MDRLTQALTAIATLADDAIEPSTSVLLTLYRAGRVAGLKAAEDVVRSIQSEPIELPADIAQGVETYDVLDDEMMDADYYDALEELADWADNEMRDENHQGAEA